MESNFYKGYYIIPKVYKTAENHENVGQWMSGEYSIRKYNGDSVTEKTFSHNTDFFVSKEDAIVLTLQLAYQTIDNEMVGF